MNKISDKAVVSPNAKIGKNVSIGHFSIVEDDVIIGDNVSIAASAVISCEPQDLKFSGENTTLEIGENTVIREFVTVARGTYARGKSVVGKNCFIMAYVHIPHDSIIGDNVLMANAVNMGGHVKIDDWAIKGGLTGIHQFVRVGCHSFIAFGSKVTQDVPPYILAGGSPLNYKGLNIVGLKRRGFNDEQLKHIKQVYNYIYGSKYNISDAVKGIKDSVPMTDEVKKIINFIESSERGIIRK